MIDFRDVRRADDPLRLRRKRRRSTFLASLVLGTVVTTLWNVDSQARPGEQRRESVVEVRQKSGPLKGVDFQFLSVTVFLTSGTTWTVPSDCIKVDQVDCIGGGGSGNRSGGGGGGAWSRSVNIAVTPGASVNIGIGGASGDTWFNATSAANAATLGNTIACAAKGGAFGIDLGGGRAAGGAASGGTGTSKFSGGNGGLGPAGNPWIGGAGGGGAAGPNGNGNNGADKTGGATGGAGGAGDAGFGGAGGPGTVGGAGTGGNGTEYDASHGSGGGGSGGYSASVNGLNGGAGGFYGGAGGGGGVGTSTDGGGGAARQGLIVIVFTSFNMVGIRRRQYLRR